MTFRDDVLSNRKKRGMGGGAIICFTSDKCLLDFESEFTLIRVYP